MKSLLRFFGHAVRDTSTIADLGGVGYEGWNPQPQKYNDGHGGGGGGGSSYLTIG